MNDDMGARLLAAVETLMAEIKGLRSDMSRDSIALTDRRKADAERQARKRERAAERESHVTSRDSEPPSRDAAVKMSRDANSGHVTSRSLKDLSSSTIREDLQKEQKIAPSRDNSSHVTVMRKATWEAYSAAFANRYGAEPVRNAKVNAQVCQLVERLGADAPEVAVFYVAHSGAWYVKRGHDLGSFLGNAETLHMEWRTGRRITATGARQEERTAANGETIRHLLREGNG